MNQPRHLPAEWAPQWAVMLTWPHAGMDCQRNFAEVEALFLTLASAIAQRQQLIVSVTQPQQLDALRDHLRQAGIAAQRLIGQVVPANDFWARDHGPITVLSGDQPRLLDFRFNGWGGKYPAELDNQISSQLHRRGAFGSAALEPIDWVFEGGNLECDGAGTLLLNRQSVLTASRNPGLNEAMVEAEFRRLLGIYRVLWISHGHIEGDDTDGHIDVLARFTDPDTLCHISTEDRDDPNFAELDAMAAELRALRKRDGTPYRLVPLPLPAAQRSLGGEPLALSYANFLIINGAVLLPVYRDPADRIALAQLARCFPDREIVPIMALPLVEHGGSIHCVTMQLPAARW